MKLPALHRFFQWISIDNSLDLRHFLQHSYHAEMSQRRKTIRSVWNAIDSNGKRERITRNDARHFLVFETSKNRKELIQDSSSTEKTADLAWFRRSRAIVRPWHSVRWYLTAPCGGPESVKIWYPKFEFFIFSLCKSKEMSTWRLLQREKMKNPNFRYQILSDSDPPHGAVRYHR